MGAVAPGSGGFSGRAAALFVGMALALGLALGFVLGAGRAERGGRDRAGGGGSGAGADTASGARAGLEEGSGGAEESRSRRRPARLRRWPSLAPPAADPAPRDAALTPEVAPDPRASNEPPSEPDWTVLSWKDAAVRESEIAGARQVAESLDRCPEAEVQRVACTEPPCLVFFSAEEAPCVPFEELKTLMPGCPVGEGGDGIVMAAPIRCPDGFVECVRALIVGDPANVTGEAYDKERGSGVDEGMSLGGLFHVGRRLTEAAPGWVCGGQNGDAP